MKTRTSASPRRLAVCATLLLLAATASGCGVAMPTQPTIEPGASLHRGAPAAAMQEARDPFEVGDDLLPGGSSVGEPPATGGDEEIVTEPGPGNSDWGHSRKGPKR